MILTIKSFATKTMPDHSMHTIINKMKACRFALIAAVFTSTSSYAYENISPTEAYEMAATEPNTYIIDVRSDAEWSWVGHPGVNKQGEGLGLYGKVINVSYKIFHEDQFVVNPHFANDLNFFFRKNKKIKLITMCRSGLRSVAAAQALEADGYTVVYNMESGFEGGKDANGYRTVNGWKNDRLPYIASADSEYDVDRMTK